MTIIEDSNSAGLIARVKGILLKPKAEWEVIDAEPATIGGIYRSYVVPLAAITPICSLIGSVLIGNSMFGVTYRSSLVGAIVAAVLSYVMTLVLAYFLALIIDALAPNFGGTKNKVQAFKVAAYSATASWVVGVVTVLPMLAPLAIIGGLYSLYLFYVGLPLLMKAPQEKALPYTAVVIVCAIVLSLVVAAIVAPIVAMTGLGAASSIASGGGSLSGKVKIGGNEIDLAKLEAAGKQMEAQSKVLEAQARGDTAGAAAAAKGTVQAVPGEVLKAMLPGNIGGFSRTEVESSTGGVGGMQGSNAGGTYTRGDDRLDISVTDMAAMGGLAGLAGAVNLNSSKETSTGYEKVTTAGGRMVTEEYDRSNKSGKYGVVVGQRFMVEAHGTNVTMDELKAAVSSVGLERLEGMAKG